MTFAKQRENKHFTDVVEIAGNTATNYVLTDVRGSQVELNRHEFDVLNDMGWSCVDDLVRHLRNTGYSVTEQ